MQVRINLRHRKSLQELLYLHKQVQKQESEEPEMKYLFPAKEMCIMGECNIVVHVLSIAWNKLHL